MISILILIILLIILLLVCMCKDYYYKNKQKNILNDQIIFSINIKEDSILSYDEALKNSKSLLNDFKLPSYDEYLNHYLF
jgi:hypothetical protein